MKIDPTNLDLCCLKRLERATGEIPEGTQAVCSCGNVIRFSEGKWQWMGADILTDRKETD